MMKKFKHILSLALVVLLLLTACGTVPSDPATKPAETEETIPPFATRPTEPRPDPATAEMNIKRQCFPQVIDNPDNLSVLKWVCTARRTDVGGYGTIWNETAAIDLNQMLADRNMPFRIQFVVYLTDYVYENMDWLVRPEIQEDLASADLLFIDKITAGRAKDYYMPLTGYIEGNLEPSLKNSVPHDINWLQTSANGEIYGISQFVRFPKSTCWKVDSDVLTEYGLTVEDFQRDFWEMDETLKKLKDASGKQQLIEIPSQTSYTSIYSPATNVESIYPGSAGDAMSEYFTGVGSVFAVEYIDDAPTVVNMLDTETTTKIQDAIVRYRETYAASDSRNAKLCISEAYGQQPYRKVYTNSNKDCWYVPISASCYNASPSVIMQNVSGVSAASKHQIEAVTLLSLIAEDEEFRMHLMYGKEGRDYTIDENGDYCLIKQEDESSYIMSFLSPWCYFSGLKGSNYPGTFGTLPQYEGMTVLETYLEMIENAEPYYAVPFDFSELKEERKAVEYICQLYFYRFASLTEEKYAEMIEKINAAGGTKIMAELQKQLDEWVKANPGKPVTPNRQ